MAPLSRGEVVAALVGRGVAQDRAVMYSDAYSDYMLATANVREYGPIIQHPRTGNPIPNPYLPIRERALKVLRGLQDVEAAFLWAE